MEIKGTPAPKFQAKKKEYIKVYVWELPVRIFHWVNAAAILTLLLTGLYIANPIFGATIPGEAYYSFVMGWARYIHTFAAMVFVVNLIVRVAWFFFGNKYAKSNPLKLEFWKGTFEVLKSYMFLKNNKKHYVGHNPMAELSYWIFIGLGSMIMIFTGLFLLFEPIQGTALASTVAWLPKFLAGSFGVRSLHHIVAWFFVIFVVIHVYMAFREDWLSKNGTMSSIVTGYKLEDEEHLREEEDKKDELKEAN